MKRPLVAVVSCYVVGLLLAGLFQLPLGALFAVSFLVLVLVIVLAKHRPWLIWLLIALAGWTNLATRTAVVSPDDLRRMLGDEAAIVTVRGTLQETPHIRIIERDDRELEHSLARVRVTELRRGDDWQAAAGEVFVTTPEPLPANFFGGQPVEVTGVIARPPPPLAEGLFDYRNYLATRGIFYQLKTDSTNDWQLGTLALTNPPLTDRFLNWSKKTLALGLPVEDEPLRLLWAMTLGWRTALSGDISEPFLRAGTMHLFAIDNMLLLVYIKQYENSIFLHEIKFQEAVVGQVHRTGTAEKNSIDLQTKRLDSFKYDVPRFGSQCLSGKKSSQRRPIHLH